MKSTQQSATRKLAVKLAFVAGAFCAMGQAATLSGIERGAASASRHSSGWMLGLGLTALALPVRRRPNG